MFNSNLQYVPLPSRSNPWFLIPADDSGPFFYFVRFMLSSGKRRKRWIIYLLKIFVLLGGYKMWPLLVAIFIKVSEIRNFNESNCGEKNFNNG